MKTAPLTTSELNLLPVGTRVEDIDDGEQGVMSPQLFGWADLKVIQWDNGTTSVILPSGTGCNIAIKQFPDNGNQPPTATAE